MPAETDAPAAPRRSRVPPRAGGGVAMGFAVAALASAWNPLAAPVGLVMGVAAALLAARALRRSTARRGLARAALAVSLAAALLSVAVLVLTAGAVGVDLPGEPVVKGRTAAELEEALNAARERTRAERERAARELERLAGPSPDAGRARGEGTARGAPDAGSRERAVPAP